MQKTTNVAAVARPRPPENLDGEAMLEWHRIVDEMEANGTLATTDRAMIAIYSRTWGMHHDAMRGVIEHGSVIKYSSNPGLSPYFKIVQALGPQLAKMLGELGLTPATRKASTAPLPPIDLSKD